MAKAVSVDPLADMAYVSLTLDKSPASTVTVPVLTRNGTALEGVAFKRVSTSVVFPAGTSTLNQIVAIPLVPNAGNVGKTFELYVQGASINGVAGYSGDTDQWGELHTFINFVAGSSNQQPAPPAAPPPATTPPTTGAGGTKGALVYQFDPVTFKASDQGGANTFLTRFNFGRDQAGNGELGLYTDPVLYPGTNPYEIRNGVLVMRAEKFAAPKSYNGKMFNYGACVLEANWLSQLYGYYECEAQTSSARGTWGAFWLLPSDGTWPPEIDIYEQPRNGEVLNWCTTANNHYNDANGQHQMVLSGTLNLRNMPGFPKDIDLTTGFHTYACDWRADWTVWYVDGVEVFRTKTTFTKPAYPLFDIAVGGWGGTPDFSQGSTEMLIKSFKVYK
jgi:hypothetical protein